jgi:aldose 1-epimerase
MPSQDVPAIVPSGEQIEIASGDQRATIVEVGGGLRSFSKSGRDLLDGYPVHEMASAGRGQVLIPWPNRLQDGRYEFDGCGHQLPLSEPETHTAIHGLVRWARWSVAERGPDRVVMEHVPAPRPGYPFMLYIAIDYGLSEHGLEVTTTATNRGDTACPYGCGAHPYLTLGTPSVDTATLHAPAATVLVTDERGLPVGATAVEGTEYDFRKPTLVGATRLDHAFTDLARGDDGRARVVLRDQKSGAGVTLWVDDAYPYLMLFTGDPLPDVNRRSLAVEPMTCPPNAFRTGEAVIRLEPGRSVVSRWGIAPSADAAGPS